MRLVLVFSAMWLAPVRTSTRARPKDFDKANERRVNPFVQDVTCLLSRYARLSEGHQSSARTSPTDIQSRIPNA